MPIEPVSLPSWLNLHAWNKTAQTVMIPYEIARDEHDAHDHEGMTKAERAKLGTKSATHCARAAEIWQVGHTDVGLAGTERLPKINKESLARKHKCESVWAAHFSSSKLNSGSL